MAARGFYAAAERRIEYVTLGLGAGARSAQCLLERPAAVDGLGGRSPG